MGPWRGLPVITYVDSSAVLARVFEEDPQVSLEGHSTVTSELTVVEVARRMLHKGFPGDPWIEVNGALANIALLAIDPVIIAQAATLPVRHLRSLDALHIASALSARVDLVVTLDRQMQRACTELGLAVA